MAIFYYFIIFIIFLFIFYIDSLYFRLLPHNNLNYIENMDNPEDQVVHDLSNIVVSGQAELDAAIAKTYTNNNPKARGYINNYLSINNKYKDILKKKAIRESDPDYISRSTYQPTTPNTWIGQLANSGIPLVGYLSKLYVNKPNSTECHNWLDNFDGWCKKEYGEDADFGIGRPSQLVYGQKDKYAGACSGGFLKVGGQGRSVCEAGYAGDIELPVNSTQCYLTTGDFDKACREQAGNNNDYNTGITSDYIFGVKEYLPDGGYGCWAGQRRAVCGLNYAGGVELKPNSTKCHLWTDDFNHHCRQYAGNGQTPIPSVETPSQDIWGENGKYQGGCIIGQGRAVCEKGYLYGEKIKPNSTQCYLWTDDFNQKCKENYGDDWILDTRLDGYGKYKGGCWDGQGRGQCIKKSEIGNEKIPGAKCGLWSSIHDNWCRNDFGESFNLVNQSQADCAWGQGRAECQVIPSGTKKLNKNCGEWWSIRDSWCTDDFGPNWESLGRGQNGCRWGQGRNECQKK
jgi:hypothetical protein